jgi:hypothetical protein
MAWCARQVRHTTTKKDHKKGLKTEVLKPLMSLLSREAGLEILQRHVCR